MIPDIKVNITVPLNAMNGTVHYLAAAPADHRTNFSGSGLPFPSFRAAVDRTPNSGIVRGQPGQTVEIELYYPNAYRNFENGVVPPAVHIAWKTSEDSWDRKIMILGPRIPFRALTHNPLRYQLDKMFYDGTHELEVRTQEQVIRESGYPRKHGEPENVWGTRPRL